MARGYVTVRGLDLHALAALKTSAEREIVHSVRHRAPAEHITGLVGLIDKCERRMARLEQAGIAPATVEQRQMIAAAADPRFKGLRPGSPHGLA